MLKVANSCNDVDFMQLMDVYAETNAINGELMYPKHSSNVQRLYAEQDFYCYLNDFFQSDDAQYFIWIVDGKYTAALRIESYLDGLLVEAVETAPESRRRGYASCLIHATIQYLSDSRYQKIYSHVTKDNEASLSLHKACGFIIESDNAVYIDGQFHEDAFTLVYKI